MAVQPKRGFWRTCRVYFRRFRIAVWLLILALVGAAVYLNQVGLPDFVKKPLLERLHARGLDLQFTRLRLSWYRGIVAENVRFGQADEPRSPQLTVEEVRLDFNHQALKRFQAQVDALELLRGRLLWPVSESNQPLRQLVVENIQTNLRFLPEDEWSLDNFKASFAGVKIQLSGTVTHASAVRDWPFFQAQATAPPATRPTRLQHVAELLERVRFATTPEIRFDLRGDGRDPRTFLIRLLVSAPAAETPWGNFSQGRLTARLFPATNNEVSRAVVSLEAAHAQTRWGSTTNLLLNLQLLSREGQAAPVSAEANLTAASAHTRWANADRLRLHLDLAAMDAQTNLVRGALELQSARAESPWGSATNLQATAQWTHSLTNPVPLAGEGRLQCAEAGSPWAAARALRLSARLATPTHPPPSRADPSWAGWAVLEPYVLDWTAQAEEVAASNLVVQAVAGAGQWSAPNLLVSNLQARIHQQPLEVRAALDVATRALQAQVVSAIEPQHLGPLLPEGVRRALAEVVWPQPPDLSAQLNLVLPAWTNRPPDWQAGLPSSLRLQGEFKLGRGAAYRSVAISSAQAHFSYSNQCWAVPDLLVARPEGRLTAEHRSDGPTQEFYWRLASTLDPNCLRPLFKTNEQAVFDFFHLSQPPVLEAEIRGRWRQPETTALQGRVALTNFTFRGESISGVQTAFAYSNQFLLFTRPRVQLGTQHLSADSLRLDLPAGRAYLTNGYSVADPMVVTRAIGPHIARAVAPYEFSQPPVAHASGIIPLRGSVAADLHFAIEGGPFHWWKLHAQHLAGNVHWAGERLTLTDVRSEFYGGQAQGAASFAFDVPDGTDFSFSLTTTNTLLQWLMADLAPQTNHLEGRLSGQLTISRANTEAWRSTFGYGKLELRDGLIWDIPLFGVFSPVLNGLAPGLGNSRANAGSCSFLLTNGIVYSDDLEIRAQAVRLQYRGTIGLDGKTDARVEAELLRDMWVVGPILSTVFWPVTKMFEYKVTGPLSEPKTHPVFLIPRLVLLPFHPLRTLKGLFPDDTPSTRTNAVETLKR